MSSSSVAFGDLVALALAKGYEVQEVDQEGEVCMAVFDGQPEVYDKAALLKVVPYLDEIVPVEEYEAAPWQGATEEAVQEAAVSPVGPNYRALSPVRPKYRVEQVAPGAVEPIAAEVELAEAAATATRVLTIEEVLPGIRGRVFDGAGGKLVALRLSHALFGLEFSTMKVLVKNVATTVEKYHAAGWAIELA